MIREGIDGLIKSPPEGDIKPLKGCKDGRMRLCLGGYRVVFRHDKDSVMVVLYIIDVGPRGDIYK